MCYRFLIRNANTVLVSASYWTIKKITNIKSVNVRSDVWLHWLEVSKIYTVITGKLNQLMSVILSTIFNMYYIWNYR